jgi:NAD(P)-dependent dehydrogenase (short-subunit alcohol dehydrogenase family)
VSEPARLDGRVAVVTGASRGIGRAYITALADAGAQVVGLARTFERPSTAPDAVAGSAATAVDAGASDLTTTESDWFDPRPLRLACDVQDEAQVVRTVGEIVDRFGRIDVLVNNAGIFPHHLPLATEVEDWDSVMAINVRGLYLMIREIAPRMVTRGSGSIINMSSSSALPSRFGGPGHVDLMAYGVSKAAVDRITSYLGEELRDTGVAVNGLRPGGVLTDGWRDVAPKDYHAALSSGHGQRCVPEVIGPPMLHLAVQTSHTMTGQTVAAREFGTTWP